MRSLVGIAIVLAVVFGLGYLVGLFNCGYWATAGRMTRQMPVFYVKKAAPEICLTFDISWGDKTLPLVLNVLKQNQVPATFFISGPWAIRNRDALKMIYNDGHEIASHGDRHINLSEYPKDVVKDNISKARQDLLSVVDKVAPYFRPPNGDYDDLVIDTARELGFETIIWSVDSLDWKNPGAQYMIDRVLTKTFAGAIILCHASDSSQQIHLALPAMIKGLRAKGYKFVTLSQLAQGGELVRRDPR